MCSPQTTQLVQILAIKTYLKRQIRCAIKEIVGFIIQCLCSSVKVFNSDRRKTCFRLASLAHLHCPITLTQINIILYNIHFGHIADIGEFATLGNIHNNSNIILLHKNLSN